MASILDYDTAYAELMAQGFRSLYHNSGAFGFSPEVKAEVVGWIGQEDPSLRPQARAWASVVQPPAVPTMTQLAVRAWQEHLAGKVWVMPKSHWGYELQFGSFDWLPGLLSEVGLDIETLRPRNNGSPIEFGVDESAGFSRFVGMLLDHLDGSDFMLAFPGRATVCTVHHHKQLWWQTPSSALAGHLRALAG